jgi:hypothetical protein
MAESDADADDDIDVDDVNKPTDEEFDEFKTRISEWTKLDEQINKLKIAIRERKTHQKALTDGIEHFMTTYGYDNINTNKGRIVHGTRKTKVPIKINEVRDLLKNSELTKEQLYAAIFEQERPIIKKNYIRFIVPPVSMSLEI